MSIVTHPGAVTSSLHTDHHILELTSNTASATNSHCSLHFFLVTTHTSSRYMVTSVHLVSSCFLFDTRFFLSHCQSFSTLFLILFMWPKSSPSLFGTTNGERLWNLIHYPLSACHITSGYTMLPSRDSLLSAPSLFNKFKLSTSEMCLSCSPYSPGETRFPRATCSKCFAVTQTRSFHTTKGNHSFKGNSVANDFTVPHSHTTSQIRCTIYYSSSYSPKATPLPPKKVVRDSSCCRLFSSWICSLM